MDTAFAALSWGLCGLGLYLTVRGIRRRKMRLMRAGVIVSTANVILCSVYMALRVSVLTTG